VPFVDVFWQPPPATRVLEICLWYLVRGGLAAFIMLASGCAREVTHDVTPSTNPTKLKNLAFSLQENTTEIDKDRLVEGIKTTNTHFLKADISINRIENASSAPPASAYFGTSCDKFYLIESESESRCLAPGSPTGIKKLADEYAYEFRRDPSNLVRTTQYQIVVIEEDVVHNIPGGKLAGMKTPGIDDQASEKLCAFIFEDQIRRWLNGLKGPPTWCSYADGGRDGYVTRVMRWIVSHELGREIADLHDLMESPLQHNAHYAGVDPMRTMNDCGPVSDIWNDEFCKDSEHYQGDTCLDRLRAVAP
jgi:hypothetical protein